MGILSDRNSSCQLLGLKWSQTKRLVFPYCVNFRHQHITTKRAENHFPALSVVLRPLACRAKTCPDTRHSAACQRWKGCLRDDQTLSNLDCTSSCSSFRYFAKPLWIPNQPSDSNKKEGWSSGPHKVFKNTLVRQGPSIKLPARFV